MLMKNKEHVMSAPSNSKLIDRTMRLEWLGQTAASALWITSVFVYGIESIGDWLQLGAASAWFVANLATLASHGDEP